MPAFTVTVRMLPAQVPSDTVPVPRSRFCVPPKAKSLFHSWRLLVAIVSGAAVVLSSTIALPPIRNVPEPKA